MNKILVNIYIPSIDKTFETFLPINSKVKKIFDIIQNTINNFYNNNYIIKNDAVLIEKRSMNIININSTIKNSGLKNGSDIILM